MNKWVKYSISGAILLGFIYVLYHFSSVEPAPEDLEQVKAENTKSERDQLAEEQIRRPIPINPEGMYLIHHLFKSYDRTKKMKPMQSPIAKNLPVKSTNAFPNIYVLMGNGAYFNYEDADALIEFVKAGNVAFVCADELSYSLASNLFWGEELNSKYGECMDVNFLHDSLQILPDYHWFYTGDDGDKKSDVWNFWNIDGLQYDEYSVLSAAILCDDWVKTRNPICVRIKIGEGMLFLHCETSMFTNRTLMDDNQGLEYAERIMSHIPRGNIYWHDLSGRNSHRYLAKKGSEESAEGEGGGSETYGKRRESPLQFILDSTALRWALYLLLLGLGFYIIFQSKRRRRIIPAAEKRVNSSVEFADTVSQLYYQERRHDKIVKHQEIVFKDFIRSTYYMTTLKADDQFISALSKKSGVATEKIAQIFKAFEYAEGNSSLNDEFLITLQNNLDDFYKNCN